MKVVAIFTVVNWALIVSAEATFRHRKEASHLLLFSVPGSPWINLIILLFLLGVLGVCVVA